MKVRRRPLFLLALVALVVAGSVAVGLRWRRPRGAAGGDVLSAAPGDAWLVVTVDMAAASPLVRPLLGPDGRLTRLVSLSRAAGLGSLSDACGFEPLEHIRELMVALPEGGDRGEFGAAFSSDLAKDVLAACAEKVIRARGGRPSTIERGAFAVIADANEPTLARLAYREGGPFLIGRGAWLDAMIDAADGRGERARSEHAALRASLAPNGSSPRSLSATALLPKSLRDPLRAEVDPGAGPRNADAGVTDVSALLAIEEAGLAIAAGAGGTTEIDLELRCETAEACDGVRKLIERRRLDPATDFGVRFIGLGSLLDALSVESRDKRLTLRTHAPTESLAGAIERLLGRVPTPGLAPPAKAP